MSTDLSKSIKSIYNHDCTRCDLHQGKNTVCVPGRGGFQSKVLFVAEAPGDVEDRKGETLVGKAGQTFNALTLGVGMTEEDYYCTNIVKCRPPGNRAPSKYEVDRCRVYLNKEINHLQPDFIVLMGASAVKAFFGRSATLKNFRSRVVDWNGYSVFTTFHPSLVNYDPHAMQLLVSDFNVLVRHLNGFQAPEVNYVYSPENSGYSSNIRSISQQKRMAVDIEATGLDQYSPDFRVLSISFSHTPSEAVGFVLNHRRSTTDYRSILRELEEEIFSRTDWILIGHNVKYDLLGLRAAGVEYNGRVADTMVMANLLDENNPDKSLESLLLIHTDMGNIKSDTKEAFSRGEQEKIPLTQLLQRNCADADGTLRLYRKFLKLIKEEGMYPLYVFQGNVTRMLADVEWEGWRIHKMNMEELREDYKSRIENKKAEIERLIGYEINLNSAPQKAHLIYKELRCPVIPAALRRKKKQGEAKHPSAAKNVIKMLLWEAKGRTKKVLEALLDYSTEFKRHGFFAQIDENLKDDGKVHPNYYQTKGTNDDDDDGGTVTGRLSAKRPNIQQIPREGDIKKIFRSRWKNGIIVQLDYSQMELRVLAELANDTRMLQIFIDGKIDIHTRVASWVYKKKEGDVSSKERKFTKQVNFGISYMIGKQGLALKLSEVAGEIVTEDGAQDLIDRWFGMFPSVKSYIHRSRLHLIRHGEIATLFGRKRHLADTNPNTATGREGIRQGVNFTIQSLASDITLYRAYELWEWLRKEDMKSKIVAFVHDAVIVDSPPSEVGKVTRAMRRIFINNDFTEDFGFKMKCPLEVEIKAGPTWGELEVVNAEH